MAVWELRRAPAKSLATGVAAAHMGICAGVTVPMALAQQHWVLQHNGELRPVSFFLQAPTALIVAAIAVAGVA